MRIPGGAAMSHTKDATANARLMAAAPELLEALKGLVHAKESVGQEKELFAEWLPQALVAIAKAEGK